MTQPLDAEVRLYILIIDSASLAGHTHGMQFGVENPYFKMDPVQWFYKEWAGLYEKANKKLYVNRGYGLSVTRDVVGIFTG
jgi:hypothetical protein